MEDKMQLVPLIVHEASMARQERTIKRLWILCIIMFLSLIITNSGWIYYESQWEDVVTTTTQEVQQDVDSGNGDGDTIVNGIGDIYGTDKTEHEDNDND